MIIIAYCSLIEGFHKMITARNELNWNHNMVYGMKISWCVLMIILA